MVNWNRKANEEEEWEEFVSKTAIEKGAEYSTVLIKLKEVFPRVGDKDKAFEYAISGLEFTDKTQREIMEFLNVNIDYLEKVGVWR